MIIDGCTFTCTLASDNNDSYFYGYIVNIGCVHIKAFN